MRRWRRAVIRCAAVGAIAAAAMVLSAAGAGAATIVVATTQDVQNGSIDDLGCTLRDAIQAANTNSSDPNGCAGDNAGADTIVLEGGKTYSLSLHAVDDTNAKGDLDITGPVTIRSSGPGLATIDAASNTLPGPPIGADRAIDVRPTAGSVTLEGLKVSGGFVESNSKASFNGGGGILNESQLTVRGSEVAFNHVQGTGYLLGGGIYTRGSLGKLTVIDSTVADNSLLSIFGNEGQSTGGGIASYVSSPELTIINSTISGNTSQANPGTTGIVGGVFAGDGANHPTVTLTHVTISNNQAATETGGIEVFAGTMTGTIVAGNVVPGGLFPECYGGATSGGGNLIGDNGLGESDCNFKGPGDLVGSHTAPINPNLGTLVNNGGLTRTQVPNPGSPAIDRGSACPLTDQRGLFRAVGGACDAGAVEVGATVAPPAPPADGGSGAPPLAVAAAAVPAGPGPVAPATRRKTGKRAAALAKCKKKNSAKARARCRARARKLPV